MKKKLKPKTEEQIKREIELLEEMKPNVRRTSAFGEDNHFKIEAQIAVLRENLDEDDIYDRYEQDPEDDLPPELDAALHARRWMDGEEEESLSDGWEPLTRKQKENG